MFDASPQSTEAALLDKEMSFPKFFVSSDQADDVVEAVNSVNETEAQCADSVLVEECVPDKGAEKGTLGESNSGAQLTSPSEQVGCSPPTPVPVVPPTPSAVATDMPGDHPRKRNGRLRKPSTAQRPSAAREERVTLHYDSSGRIASVVMPTGIRKGALLTVLEHRSPVPFDSHQAESDVPTQPVLQPSSTPNGETSAPSKSPAELLKVGMTIQKSRLGLCRIIGFKDGHPIVLPIMLLRPAATQVVDEVASELTTRNSRKNVADSTGTVELTLDDVLAVEDDDGLNRMAFRKYMDECKKAYRIAHGSGRNAPVSRAEWLAVEKRNYEHRWLEQQRALAIVPESVPDSAEPSNPVAGYDVLATENEMQAVEHVHQDSGQTAPEVICGTLASSMEEAPDDEIEAVPNLLPTPAKQAEVERIEPIESGETEIETTEPNESQEAKIKTPEPIESQDTSEDGTDVTEIMVEETQAHPSMSAREARRQNREQIKDQIRLAREARRLAKERTTITPSDTARKEKRKRILSARAESPAESENESNAGRKRLKRTTRADGKRKPGTSGVKQRCRIVKLKRAGLPYDDQALAEDEENSRRLAAARAQLNSLTCQFCQVKFSSRRNLRSHLLRMHREFTGDHIAVVSGREYQCDLCPHVSVSLMALVTHKRSQHEIYGRDPYTFECVICLQTFRASLQLNEHRKAHLTADGRLPCRFCDKAFIRSGGLAIHIREKHLLEDAEERAQRAITGGPPVPETTDHQCTECSRYFGAKTSLDSHYRRAHPDKELPAIQDGISCDVCGALVATRQGLRNHKRAAHTPAGVAKFPCAICQEPCSDPTGYYKHLKNHHTVDGLVSCPRCLAVLPLKDFTKHVTLKHLMRSVCEVCGESKSNVRILEMHRQRVHGIGDSRKSCKLCGVWIKPQAWFLKQHFARKHPGQVPECVVGGADFQYKCTSCPGTFARPRGLLYHERRDHGVPKIKKKQKYVRRKGVRPRGSLKAPAVGAVANQSAVQPELPETKKKTTRKRITKKRPASSEDETEEEEPWDNSASDPDWE